MPGEFSCLYINLLLYKWGHLEDPKKQVDIIQFLPHESERVYQHCQVLRGKEDAKCLISETVLTAYRNFEAPKKPDFMDAYCLK